MKFIKWKILVTTIIVCLLPILLGIFMWDKLPDTMAIHVNMNNEPDKFAGKGFVVFGLPLLMVALQIICCLINDINAKRFGERKKFERATKWIIPAMTIILQVITLGYGLGWNIDIRKVVSIMVGGIFLVIGNYLPKFEHLKNSDVDSHKTRKINRFIGWEGIILGILFIISAFLPPIFSIICLILLIPYAIISIIYAVIVIRKK